MGASKMQILSPAEVEMTLKRLAWQIYERNLDEKELVIAGINGQGTAIAGLICKELAAISKLKIHYTEVLFDKHQPAADRIYLSHPVSFKKKSVIVIDDVVNTARTFVYALLPFIGSGASKVQTLVLVDRNHRSFPISADYIGISLSTTLQEHVSVDLKGDKVSVFLT